LIQEYKQSQSAIIRLKIAEFYSIVTQRAGSDNCLKPAFLKFTNCSQFTVSDSTSSLLPQ